MAQKTAEEERLSALILVSSIPPAEINVVTPRVLRLLRLKYLPLILLRRPFLLEEKDFLRQWLASIPESRQPDLVKQMVPEASHLISEFFSCRIGVNRNRIRCPVLVVCGREDRVVPVASMREVALWLEADFREYSNHGHWMMEEEEGEWIVRDLHRWVIQRLGEEIFLVDFSESR
jgi:pimeloyl-ACP methyl ester carboxylesterase